MRKVIVILLFVFALVPRGWAKGGRINISAKSIKRYPQEHLLVAQGEVEITYKDVKLTADKVSLYTTTKDLIAEGNVTLYQKQDYLKCDRLEFNLYSKTGVAYRAKGYFHPFYYVQGKKIEKVSKRRYIVEEGTFTTCAPGKVCKKAPAWCFKTKRMTVDVGGYARGKSVSFWIKKIPVLYTPYIRVPVYQERKTGFLTPRPGYSSTKGFFLHIPFFWAISESRDATITVTPYTKKAIRGTLEYRYVIDKESRGYFLGDYYRRAHPKRRKWSIYFEHNQWLKNDWRLLAKGDIRSDNRYARTFGENLEKRVERYTDSYVTLTKNWHHTHFYLDLRGKKDLIDKFSESTYKMPEWKVSITPTPFFGLPFYLEADNSLLSYEKKSTSMHLSHKLTRLDLHPAASLPLRIAPWFSITPKVGLRETWYSKSLKEGNEKHLRHASLSRFLPNIGVALRGPQIERLFKLKGEKRIKHTIIPEIRYTYIPPKDQHNIPYFDLEDYVPPQDMFLFSLTNWVYLYTPKGGRRLAKVRIEEGYNNHFYRKTCPTKRPFTDLLVDVDTDILPTVSLDTQVRYSVYGRGITSWDTQLNLTRGIFRFNGSYHYKKRPEERFAILEPGITLGPWNLWGAVRYDLKKCFTREKEIRAIYQQECWAATLDYIYIDNRWNDAPNEKRLTFFVTLKGIGSVGRKKYSSSPEQSGFIFMPAWGPSGW